MNYPLTGSFSQLIITMMAIGFFSAFVIWLFGKIFSMFFNALNGSEHKVDM